MYEVGSQALTIRPAPRLVPKPVTPAGAVLWLILISAMLRLVFGAAMGLGIDESYMVAIGRQPQISYFDHPPISWWLSWGAARLFHDEAAIVVRLPFIALFAATTWLMFRLTERLFSAEAGLWAAMLLNLSPVFGVTTASWVLPDGPLDCALLGFTLCLVHALDSKHGSRWWAAVGLWAGLALLSKYIALLIGAGAFLYLLSEPVHRRWLRRPEPYLAALLALLLFSPVVMWNARHGFASFLFQGGRAAGARLHPLAPLIVLGGEALFLLPSIWLPLMASFVSSLRRGPGRNGEWLLCCLGVLPIVAFAMIALWSQSRIFFHWAAPGYLMLFPLLGRAVAARLAEGDRKTRIWVLANAAVVIAAATLVASEARWNWLPELGEHFAPGADPDLAAVDWSSLKTELAQRHLIGPDSPAVAAIRWHEAGKLDYALGGTIPVLCLGKDPREYGILRDIGAYEGRNLLIIASRSSLPQIRAEFGSMFRSIDPLPPLTVTHAGKAAMTLPLYLGRDLHRNGG